MFLRENEIGGRLAPHLAEGMTVLDVGSGTGRLARWLADRVAVRPTLADVIEFDNRVLDFPYVRLQDPLELPFPDGSFDAVLLLFVLHHLERWEDQEALVREAARVTGGRLLVIEDTPTSRFDRMMNVAWDWVLNLRHGVPTPFTFRTVRGWSQVLERSGLRVEHSETYRAKWPTLMTYHHTLFVLAPDGA
jgi:ubiquinone/menaquinone biosynthesis C-methylase UbiE